MSIWLFIPRVCIIGCLLPSVLYLTSSCQILLFLASCEVIIFKSWLKFDFHRNWFYSNEHNLKKSFKGVGFAPAIKWLVDCHLSKYFHQPLMISEVESDLKSQDKIWPAIRMTDLSQPIIHILCLFPFNNPIPTS